MIIFLDKNYLDEAVLQRRQFLSQNLLPVPAHCDQSACYPHRGKLEDDKYRFLWKKIKPDVDFLHEESLKLSTDIRTITAVKQDAYPLEAFEREKCQDNSLSECVNFNLDNDIIPNSNPGSPDLFSSGETLTVENHGNIFHETFAKQDLKMASALQVIDSLKIETCLEIPKDTVRLCNQAPTLSKLKSRLVPMVPSDPFISKDGLLTCEKHVFRASLLYPVYNQEMADTCKEDDRCVQVIQEKVEKQTVSLHSKYNLEDVVTDIIQLERKEDVHQRLTCLLGTELKTLVRMPVNEGVEECLLTEINSKVVKDTSDVSKAIIPYSEIVRDDEEITFLDINEPVVTDVDRLCEDALLDTPLSAPPEPRPELDLPTCEPEDMTSSPRILLDQRKKVCLQKSCFSSEQFCNAIQAFRLAEPYNLEDEAAFKVPEKHIQQVKQLEKIEKQTIASLELQLSWDVAKLSDIGKDPTYRFDKMQIDKSEMVVPDVCETFQKASLEEFTTDNKNYPEYSGMVTDPEEEILTQTDDKADAESMEIAAINEEKPKVVVENINEDEVSSLNRTRRMNNGAKVSSIPSFGFDPLGEFMNLRSKKDTTTQRKIISFCQTSEQKGPLKQFREDDVQSVKNEDNNSRTNVPDSSTMKRQLTVKCKKTKHHLVTLTLSDAYQDLITVLEKVASTYLSLLKTSNEITRSCTFSSLSPDITRFLLKQREKYHSENNLTATEDSTYRNIVCIHGLVGTAEILVKCCLDSALGFLSAIQDRYKSVIQDSLGVVHQKLFQSKSIHSVQQIYHPKMMALCREIEVWLRKKRAKSGDNEQKILVIVRKNIPTLMNSLKKVLSLGKCLHPEIPATADSDTLIDSLDVHNCIILPTNLIKETFPWAQFCLVVEYEYQDLLEWKDHCERQNIRHMALKIEKNSKQEQTADRDWLSENSDKQICLVASNKVTGFSTLLQLLESRLNIQLYERDYTLLDQCKGLSFSDVDIDENTAILLENVVTLREDRTLHHLVARIIALSLKYTVCYCLFYTKDRAMSVGYQFPGHVVTNLCKLQTAVLNYECRSKTNFKTKIMICPDVHELAILIRKISEETLTSNNRTSPENWLERSWLTSEFTQEEKYLLQNPCISSFNAQLMLRTLSINTLMTKTTEDLVEAVPGISKTTISMFLDIFQQQNRNLTWKAKEEIVRTKPKHENNVEVLCDREVVCPVSTSIPLGPEKPVPAHQIQDVDTSVMKSDYQSKHQPQAHDTELTHYSNKVCYSKPGPRDTSMYTPSGKSVQHTVSATKPYVMQYQKSGMLQSRTDGPVNMDSNKPTNNPRQTPARRQLAFTNRSLTKAEQSFREFYRTKPTDKTPQKDELQQTQTDHVLCETSTRPIVEFNTFRIENDSNVQFQLQRPDHDSDTQCSNRQNEMAVSRGMVSHDDSAGCLFNTINGPSAAAFDCPEKPGKQSLPVENKSDIPSLYLENRIPNFEVNAVSRNIYDHENIAFGQNSSSSLYQHGIGQPIETFDYNHGLTQTNNNSGTTPSLSDSDGVERAVTRRTLQEELVALMKEFPPSYEVDKIKDIKCTNTDKTRIHNQHSVQSPKMLKYDDVDTGRNPPNYNKQRYVSEQDIQGQASVNSYPEDSYNLSFLHAAPDHDSSEDKENKLQVRFMTAVESSVRRENSVEHDRVRERANNTGSLSQIDSSSGNDRQPIVSSLNEIYLNPGMDRITLRPTCVPVVDKTAGLGAQAETYGSNLEDDLRESTRRFLQNSEELPRFGSNIRRYPIQERRIGLAQPLQRRTEHEKQRRGTEISSWPGEEKRKMIQSPWATAGSPPMDLDYEDSQANMILNNHQQFNDYTNRLVFTGQTPQKRRRLTYQKMPGRRGQTKLIFQ